MPKTMSIVCSGKKAVHRRNRVDKAGNGVICKCSEITYVCVFGIRRWNGKPFVLECSYLKLENRGSRYNGTRKLSSTMKC